MLVRLSGSMSSFRPVQFENARGSMHLIFDGRVISVNLMQSLKAYVQRLVSSSGRETEVIEARYECQGTSDSLR